MSNLVKKLLFLAVILPSTFFYSGCSTPTNQFYNEEGIPCTITSNRPEQGYIGKTISEYLIWQKVLKKSRGTIDLLDVQRNYEKTRDFNGKLETKIHYPPNTGPTPFIKSIESEE